MEGRRGRGEPVIGVVTPTYRRETLLGRFLKRLVRQTYPNWRAVVVHDGPGGETRELVGRFARRDGRIGYLETPERGNDVGVTPRHTGAGYFEQMGEGGPDYCVFWDDDNWFDVGALGGIARAVEEQGWPDLLMVGVEYRARVLPPEGVAVGDLKPGEVDTACLVVRPGLAREAYTELLRRKAGEPGKSFYAQDYMVFDYLRGREPGVRVGRASGVKVGFHDGLRWKPYLRHLVGIPPLELGRRPWVRAVTLGMVKGR